MKKLRPLTLTTIAFLFYLTASGQLISKKGSAAIDKILTESSGQFKPKTYIIQSVSMGQVKNQYSRPSAFLRRLCFDLLHAFGTCHSRSNPPRHQSYGKSQIPTRFT